MDDKILELLRLQNEVLTELKEGKSVSGAMSAQQLHGLGGLLSQPGLDQYVFSTFVRPETIADSLPLIPSVYEDPRFDTITGFTAPDGTQPTNACDDAPTGYTKDCQLTALFGLKRFDTQEIEFDKVMLRVNRSDFTDLILVGNLIGETGLKPGNIGQEQALSLVIAMEQLKVAAYMEMALHLEIWRGTTAVTNNFPGLDAQITTGQVDAATNTACPSLDSDVKDFNYNDVCGTTLDIVEYVSSMAWYLERLAASTGLAPTRWILAMRPELWHELTACWPCNYMTNRCRTAQVGYNAMVINDSANVDMRDEMRNGMFLWINGKKYPVVVDTGIYEQNNQNDANVAAGYFASSIYFVPTVVRGAFPVTYREYVDYRMGSAETALLRGKEDWWITDNGAYSWAIEQQKWCYKLALKTEQRIVLRTPQLAGKIDNVLYTPLQHLRDPDPDSPYHVDGGVSLRTPGTRYSVWSVPAGR